MPSVTAGAVRPYRIAFINANRAHAYDPDTPRLRPLAGAESAQVHLAAALAARGHEVWLFNGVPRATVVRGVRCAPLPGGLAALRGFDAYFLTHYHHLFGPLRAAVGPVPLVVCWEHDVWNAGRHRERLRALSHHRDFVALVSDWHRAHFVARGVPAERTLVIRNAISPWFQDLFGPGEDVLAAKEAGLLGFTASPYKGLAPAVTLFGVLHQVMPALNLAVFSDFTHYPPNNVHRRRCDSWSPLYELCRRSPGVRYVGTLPQPGLAQALRPSLMLFYPALIEETSAITVMEAMAAGMLVVTVDRGALPETLHGFGWTLPAAATGAALPVDAYGFCRTVAELLLRARRRDPGLVERLRSQVDFASRCYRWSVRAAELEQWLAREGCPGALPMTSA